MRELKKLNEEGLLFYDLESAPLVKTLEIDTPLYNSWEYKVNKDGGRTSEEIIEQYPSESALYPEFAKVVCIVVGKISNGKIKLITLDDEDEVDILSKFNEIINRNIKDRIVGFANIGFDTPFVFKRMLINGIAPHDKLDSSGLKPWTVDEVDLSVMWKGTSFNRGSLLNIATAFGLPSPKDDISGKDVGRVYYEGGLKRIAKYCRADVVTTINIFKKMRLEDSLELAEGFEDPEPIGVLEQLMNGGEYNRAIKKLLVDELKEMDSKDRAMAFTVLDSVVSTAKNKKTKLTKAHVKTLRKMFEGE